MGLARVVRTASAFVGIAGFALVALPAASASAATINVTPGHSIQAAIDSASPGDTIMVAPGTYQESVEVTKSVNIFGAGQGATILEPPVSPPTTQSDVCFDPASPTEFDGFCIHGDIDTTTGDVTTPVGPVHVKGFTVKNFGGTGVFFLGATSPQADHNTLLHNADYGVVAFQSTDDTYDSNVANFNGEAGLYVGDSPEANAKVTNNVSKFNDDFGILVRDASGGTTGVVSNNVVRGNCGGILFLNTGSNPSSWQATGNLATANNNICSGGPPTAGGIGIGVAGVNNVTVTGNLVRGNAAPAMISGGVVVALGASNTTVTHNVLRKNAPDILYDGSGSANTFSGNRCSTSVPSGLC